MWNVREGQESKRLWDCKTESVRLPLTEMGRPGKVDGVEPDPPASASEAVLLPHSTKTQLPCATPSAVVSLAIYTHLQALSFDSPCLWTGSPWDISN